MTQASTLLSVVDNLSLADSNKAVESSLAQYGESAKNAGEAFALSMKRVDSWSNVAHNAMVSAKDLADANERTGAVAKQVGVDFDNLQGLIASAVRNTGMQGANIGNMLKTVFGSIHSDESVKQIESLGVAMKQIGADGKETWRPVIDVLHDLQIATAGSKVDLEDMEKAMSGGKFQWAKAAAMLGDYNTTVQATDYSINSVGKTAEYVSVQMDTLSKKVDVLQQHLVGLNNSKSGGLSDLLKGLTDAATNLVSGLEQINATTILGTAGALLAIGNIKKIISVFGELGKAVKMFSGEMAIMDALSGNLPGLIAGIGALVGIGIVEWYGSTTEKQKELNAAWDEAKKQAPQVADMYGRQAQQLQEYARQMDLIKSRLNDPNVIDKSKLQDQLKTLKDEILKFTSGDQADSLIKNNFSSEAIQSVIDSLNQKQKSVQSDIENGKSQVVVVQELGTQYEQLSKRMDDQSLSEQERTKTKKNLLDVESQIAKLFPDLVKGYDNEGNIIWKVVPALKALNDEAERKIALEKQALVSKQQSLLQQEKDIEAAQSRLSNPTPKDYLSFGVADDFNTAIASDQNLVDSKEKIRNELNEVNKQLAAYDVQATQSTNSTKKLMGAADESSQVVETQKQKQKELQKQLQAVEEQIKLTKLQQTEYDNALKEAEDRTNEQIKGSKEYRDGLREQIAINKAQEATIDANIALISTQSITQDNLTKVTNDLKDAEDKLNKTKQDNVDIVNKQVEATNNLMTAEEKRRRQAAQKNDAAENKPKTDEFGNEIGDVSDTSDSRVSNASTDYDALFTKLGKESGYDPLLLKAIAIKESGINPNVSPNHNPNGTIDYGLMQINNGDGNWDINRLQNDPTYNIQAAIATLNQKVSFLTSHGYDVNPENLFHAYNGWNSQGQGYANDALNIYKQLGGVVNSTITPVSGITPTGDKTIDKINADTQQQILAEKAKKHSIEVQNQKLEYQIVLDGGDEFQRKIKDIETDVKSNEASMKMMNNATQEYRDTLDKNVDGYKKEEDQLNAQKKYYQDVIDVMQKYMHLKDYSPEEQQQILAQKHSLDLDGVEKLDPTQIEELKLKIKDLGVTVLETDDKINNANLDKIKSKYAELQQPITDLTNALDLSKSKLDLYTQGSKQYYDELGNQIGIYKELSAQEASNISYLEQQMNSVDKNSDAYKLYSDELLNAEKAQISYSKALLDTKNSLDSQLSSILSQQKTQYDEDIKSQQDATIKQIDDQIKSLQDTKKTTVDNLNLLVKNTLDSPIIDISAFKDSVNTLTDSLDVIDNKFKTGTLTGDTSTIRTNIQGMTSDIENLANVISSYQSDTNTNTSIDTLQAEVQNEVALAGQLKTQMTSINDTISQRTLLYKEQEEAMQNSINEATTAENQRYNLVSMHLNDQMKYQQQLIDQQMKALDAQSQQASYNKNTVREDNSKSKLQREINGLQFDTSAAAKARLRDLNMQMQDLNARITDTQDQHNIDLQKQALQNQLLIYQQTNQAQQDQNKAQHDFVTQNLSDQKSALDQTKQIHQADLEELKTYQSNLSNLYQDLTKDISTKISTIGQAYDQQVASLQQQKSDLQAQYAQEKIQSDKHWNDMINSAKNGTLTYEKLMNPFYQTALSELKQFGDDVDSQMNRLKQIYGDLGQLPSSMNSTGSSGNGTQTSLFATLTQGTDSNQFQINPDTNKAIMSTRSLASLLGISNDQITYDDTNGHVMISGHEFVPVKNDNGTTYLNITDVLNSFSNLGLSASYDETSGNLSINKTTTLTAPIVSGSGSSSSGNSYSGNTGSNGNSYSNGSSNSGSSSSSSSSTGSSTGWVHIGGVTGTTTSSGSNVYPVNTNPAYVNLSLLKQLLYFQQQGGISKSDSETLQTLTQYIQGKGYSMPSLDQLSSFDTGGWYTGDSNSNKPIPAFLHAKEIVLNQQQSKDILQTVKLTDNIMSFMRNLKLPDFSSLIKPAVSTVGGDTYNFSFPGFTGSQSDKQLLESYLVNTIKKLGKR